MTHEEKQIHNAVHAELREFEEFKQLVKRMRDAQKNYYKDRPKVGYKVAYTFLSRAMLRIGMVIPDEGKGKAVLYKWNLAKFGPPSLALAEKMIFETEDQARISARDRYWARVARTKREENSRGVEVIGER